jgi:hypothetical protein
MSELIFKFETRELVLVKELTVYNSVVHKLKFSKFNFDHIKEVYNDVDDSPFYEFGVIEDNKFICLFSGEGDPVPEGKENTGGVYVNVYIHCPEYLTLKKESK